MELQVPGEEGGPFKVANPSVDNSKQIQEVLQQLPEELREPLQKLIELTVEERVNQQVQDQMEKIKEEMNSIKGLVEGLKQKPGSQAANTSRLAQPKKPGTTSVLAPPSKSTLTSQGSKQSLGLGVTKTPSTARKPASTNQTPLRGSNKANDDKSKLGDGKSSTTSRLGMRNKSPTAPLKSERDSGKTKTTTTTTTFSQRKQSAAIMTKSASSKAPEKKSSTPTKSTPSMEKAGVQRSGIKPPSKIQAGARPQTALGTSSATTKPKEVKIVEEKKETPAPPKTPSRDIVRRNTKLLTPNIVSMATEEVDEIYKSEDPIGISLDQRKKEGAITSQAKIESKQGKFFFTFKTKGDGPIITDTAKVNFEIHSGVRDLYGKILQKLDEPCMINDSLAVRKKAGAITEVVSTAKNNDEKLVVFKFTLKNKEKLPDFQKQKEEKEAAGQSSAARRSTLLPKCEIEKSLFQREMAGAITETSSQACPIEHEIFAFKMKGKMPDLTQKQENGHTEEKDTENGNAEVFELKQEGETLEAQE